MLKIVALCILERARQRSNFGNGGEVENLLSRVKASYQLRISTVPISERPEEVVFEPEDFDVDFDRTSIGLLGPLIIAESSSLILWVAKA